ncbi:hypothetical protein CEUSTIGMA_g4363.t1 [Chlamydomonas eustigma]|uniref:Tyrosine-protein kinase ephrin type A/B receptor-like domain-containing protein n=1 Tax=Chlamydomonas eustigma TaxID=1157962 RepID=A0A250X1G2_9CHLO|nr:hypothetical protein CEUSTIGMA_g4363.t1 [Chlamydomonas eustigma]|eukprot:GAX76917.1 hypothetical protein CEUSTIGMA_g4363.t1 [Chlamydomonas eustigma]
MLLDPPIIDLSPKSNTCDKCIAGYYQSKPGQSVCVACDPCFYAAGTGTATCTQCSVGETSTSGSSSCTVCPAGQYADAQAYQASGICRSCPAGYYQPASSNSSTCLALCPPGTFSNIGSTACSASPCGYVTANNATARCAMCAAGFYANADPGAEPNASGVVGANTCLAAPPPVWWAPLPDARHAQLVTSRSSIA